MTPDCEKPGDCAYPGCDCPEDDDPFDDDAELECDHMDYDLDILTGRAECPTCGHRWFMSEAELKRDEKLRQMPYPGDEE